MLCCVAPTGAGQDVGKSCVVVRLGGKTLMFDCGMHLGYQDERRWVVGLWKNDSSRVTAAGAVVAW